jgi:hypothetical protein
MKSFSRAGLFVILFFTLLKVCYSQTSYKIVCDRRDNTIKIVESEDRSPDYVPIRGGFPFIQIAEQYIENNFPDRKCDPAALMQQNQQTTGPVSGQTSPAGQQSVITPGPPPAPDKSKSGFLNNSLLFALAFSNLGQPFDIEPPLFWGGAFGYERLLGKRLYLGLGAHVNILGGMIYDYPDFGDESFMGIWFIKTPIFLGFRAPSGSLSYKAEFGFSYFFKPHPLSNDWDMQGLEPGDGSMATTLRVKLGLDVLEFELGFETGIADIFSNYEGFQHRIFTLGVRVNF